MIGIRNFPFGARPIFRGKPLVSGRVMTMVPNLHSQAAKPRFFVVNRCQAEKSHKRMGWEQRRSFFVSLYVVQYAVCSLVVSRCFLVLLYFDRYICIYICIYIFMFFICSCNHLQLTCRLSALMSGT